MALRKKKPTPTPEEILEAGQEAFAFGPGEMDPIPRWQVECALREYTPLLWAGGSETQEEGFDLVETLRIDWTEQAEALFEKKREEIFTMIETKVMAAKDRWKAEAADQGAENARSELAEELLTLLADLPSLNRAGTEAALTTLIKRYQPETIAPTGKAIR